MIPVKLYAQTGKITTYDVIGGLHTADISHALPVNDFKDLQDVFTDNNGYIEVRGGLNSVITSTGPHQNMYEFINMAGNK